MNSIDEILFAAQSLPSNERARLIAHLWDNLDPAEWVPPTDEWIGEAQRRSELLRDTKMTTSSWDEARQRARRKAGLDD